MASFVHNNWKGHFDISVSELCFKNALGLLINYRSNFQEERIIVRKIAATFREEQIIARKFGMNHLTKRIIIQKIARIKTIGVTKMQGNFVEISFQAKFLRKATKSQEFRRNSFALLLHNTVGSVCIVKNCDLGLENAALALGPPAAFQDLGHCFSLYGPSSRQITYYISAIFNEILP